MKLQKRQNFSSPYGSDDDELNAEINIIPLVDIMLVLLIIFMIAAPLSLSTVKVNLPKTHKSKSLQKEPKLILSIDKEGNYYLAKRKLKKGTLIKKLKGIVELRRNKSLYISADKSIKYNSVIVAMNAAKKAGIHKVSLLTQPTR